MDLRRWEKALRAAKQRTHNRLVVGSKPTGPTMLFLLLPFFLSLGSWLSIERTGCLWIAALCPAARQLSLHFLCNPPVADGVNACAQRVA